MRISVVDPGFGVFLPLDPGFMIVTSIHAIAGNLPLLASCCCWQPAVAVITSVAGILLLLVPCCCWHPTVADIQLLLLASLRLPRPLLLLGSLLLMASLLLNILLQGVADIYNQLILSKR